MEGVTGRMHSRKKVSQCSLRVLRSSRAVQVNVAIMRAFVKDVTLRREFIVAPDLLDVNERALSLAKNQMLKRGNREEI